MTPETQAKVEAAQRMIVALCKRRDDPGKREWIMSIPARPDYDPDIVIASALNAAVGEIERAEARIMELIPIWNAIEQVRASIESTARLMGEGGHVEQQKMLHRWHLELRAALERKPAELTSEQLAKVRSADSRESLAAALEGIDPQILAEAGIV